jgi:hypothetical protein
VSAAGEQALIRRSARVSKLELQSWLLFSSAIELPAHGQADRTSPCLWFSLPLIVLGVHVVPSWALVLNSALVFAAPNFLVCAQSASASRARSALLLHFLLSKFIRCCHPKSALQHTLALVLLCMHI